MSHEWRYDAQNNNVTMRYKLGIEERKRDGFTELLSIKMESKKGVHAYQLRS